MDIADLDLVQKEEVLAFYEEIALMVNSRLIGRQFGLLHVWILCGKINKSDAFWAEGEIPSKAVRPSKSDAYWGLAVDFLKGASRFWGSQRPRPKWKNLRF